MAHTKGLLPCLVLVFFCVLPMNSAETTTQLTSANATVTRPMTILEISKNVERSMERLTKSLLPYVMRNSDLNLTFQCISTLTRMFVDLRRLKRPVMQMLDANPKPPPGILRGTMALMGNYEQCLSISANRRGDVARNPEEEVFHGQYCTVYLNLPKPAMESVQAYSRGKLNISQLGTFGRLLEDVISTPFASHDFQLQAGICVPSTCTMEDIQQMLDLMPISFITMEVKRCESKLSKPIQLDQLVVLSIFGIMAAFVIIGTTLDVVVAMCGTPASKSKWKRLFLAFSAYGNTKKLFKSDEGKVTDDIRSINGIYTLSIIVVIIYHTYFISYTMYSASNLINIILYLDDPKFTLVPSIPIAIETFFVLSSLLMVYGRYKRDGKNTKVNVLKLVTRRYLRLCPPVLLTLAIALVLPLFGSGPVAEDVIGNTARLTQKGWWSYIFMWANFLPWHKAVYLHLWFIPCLMQITIGGAIFLWIFSKNRKLGTFLIVLTSLACNTALAVLTAVKNYPPTYSSYFFYNIEYFEVPIYASPLSHVASYGVGMLLGYYMSQNPKIKWSKFITALGWIMFTVLTVGTQFVLYTFHDRRLSDPIVFALYAFMHRTSYALGIAWAVLACTYGYGGFLGEFLQWRGFVPLSRLSFFAYLIHYAVIAIDSGFAQSSHYFSHTDRLFRAASYTTVTYLFAYVLYITFELPLKYLETLVFPTPEKTEITNSPPSGKENNQIYSQETGDNGTSKHFNSHNNLHSEPHNVLYNEQSKL